MRTVSLLAALCVISLTAGAQAQQPSTMPITRLDPALDALISPDAKLELVKTGFGFTEGPVWVPRGDSGYLLFSDIPANVIYMWNPLDDKVSVYLDHSGYTGQDIWRVGFMQTNGKDKTDPKFEEFPMIGSNGLTLDQEGRLIIATWAGRSIDRIEWDGKRRVLADRYNGKRFGGTNDVVVKKDDAIYFTDGFGGLRHTTSDPRKELDFNGVYMLKDGKVTLVIKDIPNTNGLAFSPDQKILYANGSRDRYVKAYDVLPDDTLTNGRMLIDMKSDPARGITDGLRVDVKGNLWETGPGGVWIVTPDGRHIGTIALPELGANVEFGDADRKTLYIAARTSIYKIRTNVPGLP
jgi:gluconolactonase